jgi:ribose transport system ATP-binding protein
VSTPRLEVRNLSKTFAGVTVLDGAHLTIAPGEIHALVGQNGSGKSTLIKLVSGVYRADAGGEILLDGTRIGTPVDPSRLHDDGIAFVHQDLGLVDDLTVRDNVRVGRHAIHPITRWISKRKDREAVLATFDFLGFALDPEAKVSTLTPSERVAVAVARALQDRTPGSGVVVFDESSRAIPHESLESFYGMIRLLASQGTAVLLVSHNLKEVLEIADRATALRNGKVIESGIPTANLDEAALTRLVLGHEGELDDLMHVLPTSLRADGVELRGIAGGRISDVSAHVLKGEVLGITGTVDSGLSSFASLIGGASRASGEILIDGKTLDLTRSRTLDLLEAGIAFIPQDRAGKGLATALTVEENVTLPHLRVHGKRWWTGRSWRFAETDAILENFKVTPANRNAAIATFSGGNQQKVLMGKWLLGKPSLLVLDDPTQAVDVGARSSVLRATRQAAHDGAAVILCSSEVEDLAAVCDRILILEDGVVGRELQRPFTADSILTAIFTPAEGVEA